MVNGEGKSRGFGFCLMKPHEAAKKLVDAVNGKEVGGKTLFANRFMDRDERIRQVQENSVKWRTGNYEKNKDRNLYVRGFDETVTEEQLKEMFSRYGEVEAVKIMRDEHGNGRNFGFVRYVNKDDAEKCIDGAGLDLKFGAKTAFVSKAVLMSPTELIRMAIIDKYGDSGSQNALKAFHCLSEDQCRALVKDQDKLNAWLASKFLLYKEEGETKIQQYVSCDPTSTRRAQPLRRPHPSFV